MARITPTASARDIRRCVQNTQFCPDDAEDNAVNLGDAILALLAQVELLTKAVDRLSPGDHAVQSFME